MKKIYFLLLTLLASSLSFGQVLITEIADPNNNADARYIELYNMGASAVDFTEGNGWQIDKYLNAASGVNATLDLTGTIPAGGFYVIAYDNVAGTFQTVYGFAPDQLDNVSNGVAGGNGDDDLALVNGSDVIVDFFGVYDFGTDTNTDNSETCAEYEDGRAERLTSVSGPSPTFNEAEWNVWADTTVAGCTSHQNAPRNAPDDFDPGAWGTATCGFSMFNVTSTCDAFTAGTDTYSVSIDFTGGGTSTYTVSSTSGTVGGDDPTSMASGTITVTGVSEGTDITVNVTDGGLCDVDSMVTSPSCNSTLTLPITENFSYPDGSLVGNSTWENHSGTTGDLLVTSGQALVQHGAPSEDANLPFVPVTGNLYYAFDMIVQNPGSPISSTDNEYFAHFKNSAFGFFGRLYIVAPTGAGDYTVGIATDNSTADATWSTDLAFGSTYRVTVRYDQDTNIAELWLDAAAESDPSILGADETDPGESIASFALRQSDSGENEGILVDNLVIAQSFDQATLSTPSFTSNDFKIYPNPTSVGYVTISANSTEAMNVHVFDVLGKQVLNQTVSDNRLTVSGLKSGIYIMKISQNNTSVTKKLIIK